MLPLTVFILKLYNPIDRFWTLIMKVLLVNGFLYTPISLPSMVKIEMSLMVEVELTVTVSALGFG